MVCHVYIMTNRYHTVLYTGVTSNIERRTFQHKVKYYPKSFTKQYNCDKLVYFEEFGDIREAMHRERQLKKYHREWKEELIKNMNPEWKDLSDGWYDPREFEMFNRFNK
jgi:putative endonuclease